MFFMRPRSKFPIRKPVVREYLVVSEGAERMAYDFWLRTPALYEPDSIYSYKLWG